MKPVCSSAQASKLHLPDKMIPRVQVKLATCCWGYWGQPAPVGNVRVQPHQSARIVSKQAATKAFTWRGDAQGEGHAGHSNARVLSSAPLHAILRRSQSDF